MDSVYDAAVAHAEKLKTELESLQNFLDLHDHFRERFGLTPSAGASSDAVESADAKIETPAVELAEASDEVDVEDPSAEVEDAVEAEASEPDAEELKASDAEQTDDAEPETETSTEDKPRVIQASEGVLIAASEPLGPEATLQSVADKLAATISASHPAVTGYTV